MGSQTHLRAVNRTIRALKVADSDVHAARVGFVQYLARILDRADDDRFAKVAPLYLSALRALERSARIVSPARAAALVCDADETAPANVTPPNKLEELRTQLRGSHPRR